MTPFLRTQLSLSEFLIPIIIKATMWTQPHLLAKPGELPPEVAIHSDP